MSETATFSERLGAMVSKEMAGATREQAAEVFESLLHSAALTAAVAARGDKAVMSTLLTGADAYLNEKAAGFQEIGAMLGRARGPLT